MHQRTLSLKGESPPFSKAGEPQEAQFYRGRWHTQPLHVVLLLSSLRARERSLREKQRRKKSKLEGGGGQADAEESTSTEGGWN